MSRNPAAVVPALTPGVQQGLHQAERFARGLRQPADERRPQRGHRAGPADHRRLPVHQHLVARRRVGVARDVGHAAGLAGPGLARHPGRSLPAGQRERVADPAAGRPAAGPVVPDGLRGTPRRWRCSPAGWCRRRRARAGWTRGSRRGPSRRSPVAAAVVTRGRGHRDAERGGVGEGLVQRGARLRRSRSPRTGPS